MIAISRRDKRQRTDVKGELPGKITPHNANITFDSDLELDFSCRPRESNFTPMSTPGHSSAIRR